MGLPRFESFKTAEDDLKKIESALEILKLDYKTGASYISLCCPFAKYSSEHNGEDRHPSFVIYPQYNIARCYSCSARFTILDFLQYYAQLTKNPADFEYLDYLTYISHKVDEDNVVLDEEILNVFTESSLIEQYFNTRNIDLKGTCLKFLYHSTKKRVVLPVRDAYNNLVGAIGRSTEKTAFKTYNYFGIKTSKCLAGFEHRNAEKILIVEGVTDMANAYDKCARLGLNFDVYATLTASMSKWQATKLIDECKPIFMAYDMDQAGRRGQLEALKLLDNTGADTLVNVSWKGPKDVGDMSCEDFERVFGG